MLLLDGHVSHTRNLEVINLARKNGIIILTLPPHTSYRPQPLDVSVFGPFKAYYNRTLVKWMRANGFEATGIWPLSIDVFSEYDFIPSIPSNRESDVRIISY